MKWYRYLKNSEKGEALLDVESVDNTKLFVRHETKYRNYACFPNYLHYTIYTKKKVKYVNRCFHEIIFGNTLQKIYFDLDMILHPDEVEPLPLGVPIIEDEKEVPVNTITCSDSEEVVKSVIKLVILKYPQIKKRDVMVFSSHGRKKRSYHIIVDNWCVSSNIQNQALFHFVRDNLPEKWRWCLDEGMYKSIQSLRIYDTHKYNSDRVKELDSLNTWLPPFEPEDENHLYTITMGGSLISNTSSCKVLPDIADDIKKKRNYASINIVDPEIKKITDMVSGERNTYSVISISGGIISLKRNHPSWCSVCKRTHENENPYLLVIGPNRDVYFSCRRSTKKSYICSLGMNGDIPKTIPKLDIDIEPIFDLDVVPNPPEPELYLTPEEIALLEQKSEEKAETPLSPDREEKKIKKVKSEFLIRTPIPKQSFKSMMNQIPSIFELKSKKEFDPGIVNKLKLKF